METKLLSTLAQIAGIGGIALGVFLLIFRDVIRKRIFPTLTRQQAYRLLVLALVLSWSVAIAGIVAWLVVSANGGAKPVAETLQINATLWGVDLDTKGRVVASTELMVEEGSAIGRDDLEKLARWLELELKLSDLPAAPPAKLTIRVPADPGLDPPSVRRSPEGPLDVMMWMVSGSKARIPLDQEALAGWRDDFHLEILVPGYATVTREVAWGQELREEIDLEPTAVNIGVEEFTGDGVGVADRLAGVLLGRERLKVISPDSLKALRDELRRHNDLIARNPAAQVSLRALAVDYIVGGSVQPVARDR